MPFPPYRAHEFLYILVQTKLCPSAQTPDAGAVDAAQQPAVGRKDDEEQRAGHAAGERISGHAIGHRTVPGDVRHDRREKHITVLVRPVLFRAHHVRYRATSKWLPTYFGQSGETICSPFSPHRTELNDIAFYSSQYGTASSAESYHCIRSN